jgi:hypothetical protein
MNEKLEAQTNNKVLVQLSRDQSSKKDGFIWKVEKISFLRFFLVV